MAANPLLSALGAAMTAPGDYTRGLWDKGTFERETPDEFLQARGVQNPGLLQSMGLDMLTDPTVVLPVVKGLMAATAAGALGMAISKGAGKVSKELTQEQIELAAKNAAKKARKKAAKEAAAQAAQAAPSVPEYPLLVEMMPQYHLGGKRSIDDMVRRAKEYKLAAAKHQQMLDDLHINGPGDLELARTYKNARDWNLDQARRQKAFMASERNRPANAAMTDPEIWADTQARRHGLVEQPLFYSRLNEALKAADPNTAIRTPEDILQALRASGSSEGFDESELQLLLTRLTTKENPQYRTLNDPNVTYDIRNKLGEQAHTNPVNPASAHYIPEGLRPSETLFRNLSDPQEEAVSRLWSDNSAWKSADLFRLEGAPRTIGELRDFALRNPALAMQEYNLSNRTPGGVGSAQGTGYTDANVPGEFGKYSERILMPASRATAPNAYPSGQPSILERYSFGGAGNPVQEDHFSKEIGLARAIHAGENQNLNIDSPIRPQSLLFTLNRLRKDAAGRDWVSAEQVQSDVINNILRTEDVAPSDAAPEWLRNHPIIDMLKRRYPDIAMARMIRDAADRGASGVMWHPGIDVKMFTGGKTGGQKAFYGRNWPSPSGNKDEIVSRMYAAAKKYADMIPGARVDRVDLEPYSIADDLAYSGDRDGWGNELHKVYDKKFITRRALMDARRDYAIGSDTRYEGMLKTMLQDEPQNLEKILGYEQDIKRIRSAEDAKVKEMAQAHVDSIERIADEAHMRNISWDEHDRRVDQLNKVHDRAVKDIRVESQEAINRLRNDVDDILMEEHGGVKKKYADRLGGDIVTSDQVKDNTLHFAPRWGIHLPPESLEWIKKHFKVPILSAAGMAGGGSLLNALRGAGGGQPAA